MWDSRVLQEASKNECMMVKLTSLEVLEEFVFHHIAFMLMTLSSIVKVSFEDLFTDYANCSGQFISASKSTLYTGGISQTRLHAINP